MSAESAAERIVISCLTSGAERRKVQNICAEAAAIIREETKCNQLAEALEDVCNGIEAVANNGLTHRTVEKALKEVIVTARAVLARARGEW